MTPEERNGVIDECITMVKRYDSTAHKILHVRDLLNNGNFAKVPRNVEDVILQGLVLLKTKPPLHIKVLVAEVEVDSITVEAEDEHG